MENRKPFELRKVLIAYNFIQVLFSIWLFYEACIAGWFNGYNWRCQSVDYSNNPKAIRVRKSWFVVYPISLVLPHKLLVASVCYCCRCGTFIDHHLFFNRLLQDAGGTSFRSSRSSLILFSLSCEKDMTRCRLSTWYIMVSCPSRCGGVSNSFPVDTVHSLAFWIHLSISLCTRTTCLLQWDHQFRSIYGGKNTWLSFKW